MQAARLHKPVRIILSPRGALRLKCVLLFLFFSSLSLSHSLTHSPSLSLSLSLSLMHARSHSYCSSLSFLLSLSAKALRSSRPYGQWNSSGWIAIRSGADLVQARSRHSLEQSHAESGLLHPSVSCKQEVHKIPHSSKGACAVWFGIFVFIYFLLSNHNCFTKYLINKIRVCQDPVLCKITKPHTHHIHIFLNTKHHAHTHAHTLLNTRHTSTNKHNSANALRKLNVAPSMAALWVSCVAGWPLMMTHHLGARWTSEFGFSAGEQEGPPGCCPLWLQSQLQRPMPTDRLGGGSQEDDSYCIAILDHTVKVSVVIRVMLYDMTGIFLCLLVNG